MQKPALSVIEGAFQLTRIPSFITYKYTYGVDYVMPIEKARTHKIISRRKDSMLCMKFSSYYYQCHNTNVICSSLADKTIRFWDFKHNKQLQIFTGHTEYVHDIQFSLFNGGRYLCSGSDNNTIRDIKTSKSLHIFNGHEDGIWCIDISPLQTIIKIITIK
ncbi:hypothetical protein RFI_18210 [Reticulomyxa filosa]|uniref:Uncharacterized protein n=1 Tax=Reticulomyxa filosa TaxID=46433 RepID=X6MZF0_RETFI|nr:hypothetical protein RFI_18210 [Reticulomyxa filosa]|eukprot:ETO19028.1 hypothetical protein RFI_18210 [Reticulomyxa filosa]